MIATSRRRALSSRKWFCFLATLIAVSLAPAARVGAGLGGRTTDPSQVVPLDQIAPHLRETVAEVIQDHTFHQQGEPEFFPCHGSLYLSLVNEPLMPLTLWKDLSDSAVQLQKTGPDRYEGNDGAGSSAIWEFALRTPGMHVFLAHFSYIGPRSGARIDARIVLIVHSAFVRDRSKDPWVQHNVEAYVKVDSKGWKAVARTVRPILERILEEQVREAGYFISLMTRLVMTYPNWASQIVASHPSIDAETKQRFAMLVAQTKKPGASKGRPTVAQSAPADGGTRRR